MKRSQLTALASFLILSLLSFSTFAQESGNAKGVERTCMNYIEGFYEGDTSKLIAALQPGLNKFGFWYNNEKASFGDPIKMTFEEALDFARDVKEKKKFPPADAPKEVQILDVLDKIACAKVGAWWGYDYLLLSRTGDTWKIEQVIWQGPYKRPTE